MELKLFPWDNEEKPYWINPENKLEWYIDKDMTDYANQVRTTDKPPLNAICFYVCNNINGKVNPISRILLDKETNNMLADHTGLEDMAVKIDMLRAIKHFNT